MRNSNRVFCRPTAPYDTWSSNPSHRVTLETHINEIMPFLLPKIIQKSLGLTAKLPIYAHALKKSFVVLLVLSRLKYRRTVCYESSGFRKNFWAIKGGRGFKHIATLYLSSKHRSIRCGPWFLQITSHTKLRGSTSLLMCLCSCRFSPL